MQKSWYIVYTKSKCEKRVSSLLSKMNIRNYCPVYCKEIKHLRRIKLVYEPLFSSYVFVYIGENQISQIKKLANVFSLLYWKNKPAIIQEEEIVKMKAFVLQHKKLHAEKSKVNLTTSDRPSYTIENMVRNKFVKLNLPSFGYTIVAEREVLGSETIRFQNSGSSLVNN